MNVVAKGNKDYYEEQVLSLASVLNQIIRANKGLFKPEVSTNFSNIVNYFKTVSSDMYPEGSVSKFYSGEVSYKKIPMNKLVVVRYSGSDEYVSNLNSRRWSYKDYGDEACIWDERGIKSVRICDKAPKFIGYSDGIMFHVLMKDYIWLKDQYGEERRKFLENFLDSNNVKYCEVPNYNEKGDIETINVSREAGCIPLYRLDSYCKNVPTEKDSFKIHLDFLKIFAKNI